ncbi:hypothetical protein PanWU01x14_310720 [Parasponia andersonii]|uniref:Uncharacterized protein n=1 Tax=Parasponia andersonii TaxID=3476 RepID=A0A2P5AQ33_PARAD|nr:hypothetical protein PanWU01x14_310720 [Parasponia andersonii]
MHMSTLAQLNPALYNALSQPHYPTGSVPKFTALCQEILVKFRKFCRSREIPNPIKTGTESKLEGLKSWDVSWTSTMDMLLECGSNSALASTVNWTAKHLEAFEFRSFFLGSTSLPAETSVAVPAEDHKALQPWTESSAT